MGVSLRSLLAEPGFGLRLVVPPSDPAVLDSVIAWVHNSDMADPTPWLEPGQLLLTNGAQFLDPDIDPDGYVARLTAAGMLALGLATELIHPQIPDQLRAACVRHGLPLLEVAGRTPFIWIVRFVADGIAAEREQRLKWSLDAHRALARAALRTDGLGAVLAELERQLGCWVVLYDAAGQPVPIRTARAAPAEALPIVADAVRGVLARGSRAAVRVGVGDGEVTIQTVGQRNRLRGALVVGMGAGLDPAGSDLVTSVIGLAGIALDQTRTLDSARRGLRAGLLELLLSGEATVAQRTAEQLWGPLPRPPVQVVQLADAPSEMIMASLEQYANSHGSDVFFAERGASLLLIVTQQRLTTVLRLIGAGVERTVGVSTPVRWPDLDQGIDEARRAVELGSTSPQVIRFADLAAEGLVGYLEAGGGVAVARRLLAPILQRPAAERDLLLETIKVWTEHNCAWEPAAQQLHVHRHTLRNRIDQIGRLLSLDLDGFGGRAELWTAVRLVGSAIRVHDHQIG